MEVIVAFGWPTDFTWYRLLTDWGSFVVGALLWSPAPLPMSVHDKLLPAR